MWGRRKLDELERTHAITSTELARSKAKMIHANELAARGAKYVESWGDDEGARMVRAIFGAISDVTR